MIRIENESLANYLMFKLDKLSNEFTEEELGQIEELYINPISSDGNINSLDINILRWFVNLKSLILVNINLNEHIIKLLGNMKKFGSLTLNNCSFEPSDLVKIDLKNLSIVDCEFDDTAFLKNMIGLETLSIVNAANVNVNDINSLGNLVSLRLTNSVVKGEAKIYLPSLQYLYVEGTSEYADNFEATSNLKGVGLSVTQYDNSPQIVEKLKSNGVGILMNGTGKVERVMQ